MTRGSRPLSRGVTRTEIGNLLKYFKAYILGMLTTKLDVLHARQRQFEVEQTLAIFYPHYQKKQSQRECPLDMIQTCSICTKDHAIDQCLSLPGLKLVFKEAK